jgi:phosphoglycolate phosphatase
MLQGMRAVVFEIDGTLAIAHIDFALMRRRLDGLVERYGLDPHNLEHLYMLEMIDAAAAELGQAGDSRGARFYREAHDVIVALESAYARSSGMLPGAVAALQTLRQRGFKVGVVTRNSASAVRTICPLIDSLCDVFLPREAVRFVKPHPEHLQCALEGLRISAHQAMMVGDAPIDIAAGKALGLKTIAVLTGGHRPEALLASQPDLILDSVADLIPRLVEYQAPQA